MNLGIKMELKHKRYGENKMKRTCSGLTIDFRGYKEESQDTLNSARKKKRLQG
jgi:hypothetical protein